jgi:tripartite-type tricarboxylate transporter receptor subunit TctC
MTPMPRLVAAFLCLLALARPAAAQNAVTMIVGYPPGGASDLMARLMQPELSAALGAQVVVKNSPGANGTVGALELARSRPDGNTLLLAPGGSLVLTPHTRGAPFR